MEGGPTARLRRVACAGDSSPVRTRYAAGHRPGAPDTRAAVHEHRPPGRADDVEEAGDLRGRRRLAVPDRQPHGPQSRPARLVELRGAQVLGTQIDDGGEAEPSQAAVPLGRGRGTPPQPPLGVDGPEVVDAGHVEGATGLIRGGARHVGEREHAEGAGGPECEIAEQTARDETQAGAERAAGERWGERSAEGGHGGPGGRDRETGSRGVGSRGVGPGGGTGNRRGVHWQSNPRPCKGSWSIPRASAQSSSGSVSPMPSTVRCALSSSVSSRQPRSRMRSWSVRAGRTTPA